MGNGKWYVRGFREADEIIKKRNEERSQSLRFWLRKDESADVIFCDDEPFIIDEHTILYEDDMGSKKSYHFVCTKESEGRCPLCEMGNKPVLTGFFTIIDTRRYVGRNEKVYENTKKLLPVKTKMLEILRKKKQMRGSLVGMKVSIYRSTVENSPATGDDYEVIGKVENLPPNVDLTPIDYEKEFKYYSYDELKRKVVEVMNSVPSSQREPVMDDDVKF